MGARWRLKPFDADRVRALSREGGYPSLLAQLLIQRGLGEVKLARDYLAARQSSFLDPEGLPGVPEAAERIVSAVRAGRRIVIYGDYDVDGVCGTSVLWACLKLAGAKDVSYYIPHRVEEGYGLNAEALRMLAEERGAEVVVTVDCGISAVAEARLAKQLGLELIVTDHHTIGAELPDAAVVVHPRRPGGTYPFGDLCGCGVAFKLAWQICKTFGDGKKASPHLREFLIRSITLVALATVADMVPMEGENRIFVRHGLLGLESGPAVGLQALIEAAGLSGKRPITTGHVGFSLGPRINAAGRMARAMRAVELLTTDDPDLAGVIAAELNACNVERQQMEAMIVAEARRKIDEAGGAEGRGALVVGGEGWHPGVIGIVASRVVETYHRPAIVVALADGFGQGSGRSISGFDLYEALRACSGALTSFGGHRAAAGLRLPADALPAFAEQFDAHCLGLLTPEALVKELEIDAEIRLGELTLASIEGIEALEPFGMGNPRPLLSAQGLRVVGEPRFVGERKNHIQVRFSQGNLTAKAVGWNLAERLRGLTSGTACAVAFHPSINEWNGRREVQLEIKDVKFAQDEVHSRTA